MAKLNFKTTNTVTKESIVNYLNTTDEKKKALATINSELKSLKEDRKDLIEDGKILESVSLHSQKSDLLAQKSDTTKYFNTILNGIKKDIVSKDFFDLYTKTVEKETVTKDEDTAWKYGLAKFLENLGVGGTDTEKNIDKFNPYRWTGKGKGYGAFSTLVVDDIASILIDKKIIAYNETSKLYEVA